MAEFIEIASVQYLVDGQNKLWARTINDVGEKSDRDQVTGQEGTPSGTLRPVEFKTLQQLVGMGLVQEDLLAALGDYEITDITRSGASTVLTRTGPGGAIQKKTITYTSGQATAISTWVTQP